MRDSQTDAWRRVGNTGLIVTVDLGEYDKLHPSHRDKVGARCALAARALAYGEKDVAYLGPMYHSMRKEGARIALLFNHIGSGLVAKGGALDDFTICGSDKEFVPAQAEIRGDEVVVWSEQIADPVAVRYGWKNWFTPTLYSREGLPAPTFRTDSFPLRTQESR